MIKNKYRVIIIKAGFGSGLGFGSRFAGDISISIK
jgi:hypothetical protein